MFDPCSMMCTHLTDPPSPHAGTTTSTEKLLMPTFLQSRSAEDTGTRSAMAYSKGSPGYEEWVRRTRKAYEADLEPGGKDPRETTPCLISLTIG
jgi:hypothetical protein